MWQILSIKYSIIQCHTTSYICMMHVWINVTFSFTLMIWKCLLFDYHSKYLHVHICQFRFVATNVPVKPVALIYPHPEYLYRRLSSVFLLSRHINVVHEYAKFLSRRRTITTTFTPANQWNNTLAIKYTSIIIYTLLRNFWIMLFNFHVIYATTYQKQRISLHKLYYRVVCTVQIWN